MVLNRGIKITSFSAPATSSRGLFLKILSLLFTPRLFFRNPYWGQQFWIPLLGVAGLLAALRLAQYPLVKAMLQDPQYLTQIAQQQGITEEQAQSYALRLKRLYPVGATVESFLMVIAGAAGAALLLYPSARLLYRRSVPFQHHLELTSWVGVINGIPFIIHLPFNLVEPQFQLPTNLSFLLTQTSLPSTFIKFSRIIDPFVIWQMILVSMGLSTLYEVPIKKVFPLVGIYWFLFGILLTAVG